MLTNNVIYLAHTSRERNSCPSKMSLTPNCVLSFIQGQGINIFLLPNMESTRHIASLRSKFITTPSSRVGKRRLYMYLI